MRWSFAALAAVLTLAASARAEERRGVVDWGRLLVQADHFARTGSEQLAPPPPSRSGEQGPSLDEPYVENPGNAWFGVAPRVAFVARDWGSAYRLAGDRLSLVDAMRLSRSTRMVVTRVRFGDLRVSRITPFAQIGLGQWRTDTNLMPILKRNTELAGQIGGGIELQLTRTWQMAAESTLTALYREQREADDIPQTRLWSVMFASHLEF